MQKTMASKWLAWTWVLCLNTTLPAAVQRAKFGADGRYLVIEVLRDDVIHLEMSAAGSGPGEGDALYASPMVHKRDYAGPVSYSRSGNVVRTSQAELAVDEQTLCVAVKDRTRNASLTTVCPVNLGQPWKGVTLARGQMENAYGLGQQFKQRGSSDGDWLRHGVRDSGPFGNDFVPVSPGGMVGNVQFPVLFAVGRNRLNYAFFLDNVYKQTWTFQADPWRAEMFGDQIRFYIFTGAGLPELRQAYMELVGRPPVPPKKALGLWVSEFGYRNWDRIYELASGLRTDGFPIDGFVLDLFWFGGVQDGSDDSRMGALNWDETRFPQPDSNLAKLAGDHLDLVAIEESYISRNTDSFAPLRDGKLLAFGCNDGAPTMLTAWFGHAGMVDWSNVEAGAWVHDNRRFPNLVRKGVTAHWTDLGEPERYDAQACYKGAEITAAGRKDRHADVHNLYSFLWNQSIFDGYYRKRAEVTRRPFVLTRSGASGIQRFGSVMWSGDIGSNVDLLASQANAQLHMSMSGIDYYGSDTGGFRREAMPCNGSHSATQYEEELFTQWFANAAWFDVPVRPHTDNAFQSGRSYETAPNKVGQLRSNLENIRQRYELAPYYYSLAHRAFLAGEPVVPPLVYYYQDDPNVREMGHQKLIGRDLMVAIVAKHGEYARNVYLPEGKWIDYHTNEWFGGGRWLRDFPAYIDGILRLPAFARAGAILPVMHVDGETKDSLGHRRDGSRRDELGVRVYASPSPTRFTLYEDDGTTLGYDAAKRPVYQVRTTAISQVRKNAVVTVTIDAAQGTYAGAPTDRDNVARLVAENAEGVRVRLNGSDLPQVDAASFEAAPRGWFNAGHNVIFAKSGALPVTARKVFEFSIRAATPGAAVLFACENGWTQPGENVYAAGASEQLGAWDPEKALKLEPNIGYRYIYEPCGGPGPAAPTWTRLVTGMRDAGSVEWKCVKRLNSGQWQWQPGLNNLVSLPPAGYAGVSRGSF